MDATVLATCKKAWMTNNIMDDSLSSLNQRLQRRQRNILMFLDNAPFHSTNRTSKIPRQRRNHLTAESSQSGNVNTTKAF